MCVNQVERCEGEDTRTVSAVLLIEEERQSLVSNGSRVSIVSK